MNKPINSIQEISMWVCVWETLQIYREQHAAEPYLHHGALLCSKMVFQFLHHVLPSWPGYSFLTNFLSNSWEYSLGPPQGHAIQHDSFKTFQLLLEKCKHRSNFSLGQRLDGTWSVWGVNSVRKTKLYFHLKDLDNETENVFFWGKFHVRLLLFLNLS